MPSIPGTILILDEAKAEEATNGLTKVTNGHGLLPKRSLTEGGLRSAAASQETGAASRDDHDSTLGETARRQTRENTCEVSESSQTEPPSPKLHPTRTKQYDLPFAGDSARKSRLSQRRQKSSASVAAASENKADGASNATPNEDDDEDDEPFGWCWVLEEVVAHPAFEAAFAILILINSLIMSLQAQYRGIDNGFTVEYHSSIQSAESAWPYAKESFVVLEWIFAVLFSLEIVMKISAKRMEFFRDYWNIFDFLIVFFWFLETLGGTVMPFPPMLLRLARLVKLLRLLRLVRKIQSFESLYIMTTSIKGSMSALVWSTVLLLILQMMVALLLNEMLQGFLLSDEPRDSRHEVYAYYGTFSRAMLSMFELTLANWIVPSRVLSERVTEWYSIFAISYQLVIGFAVVKVIVGVFLHETFKVASTDDHLMVSQKERATKLHRKKMQLLFEVADTSGEGFLDKEKFINIVSEPSVKTWLSAMELDVRDADALFDLVDDGTGTINAEALIKGLAKLKGTARSIDMVMLLREIREAKAAIQELVNSRGVQCDAPHAQAPLPPSPPQLLPDASMPSPRREGADAPRKEPEGGETVHMQSRYSMGHTDSEQTGALSLTPTAPQSELPVAHRVSGKKPSLNFKREKERKFAPGTSRVYDIVMNPSFEVLFGVLILANSLIMAAEVQYAGIDTGFEIGYARTPRPAAEVFPGALTAFEIFEWFFGIAFTVELLLKGWALRRDFCDLWNIFDSVIVLFWFVGQLGAANLPLDPMMLRLARLVRLLRLLRLVRTMQGFDALYLMVTSIKGSVSALAWSIVLLFIVQMMIALFLNQMLDPYIQDLTKDVVKRQEVYEYFGTFTRSMLTMFEITLANWVPVCRMLLENVSEFYVIFAILHKCIIGFAVVQVITGVFMQQTFKIAATDDSVMAMQKQRAIKLHGNKMRLLFEAADENGDGDLDRDEFLKIMNESAVRTWLAAMEMQVDDAEGVFNIICNAEGVEAVTAEQLVRGVAQLKGQARSLDLHLLMHEHKKLMSQVADLKTHADNANV